jgi:hypothetical protein
MRGWNYLREVQPIQKKRVTFFQETRFEYE